MGCWRGFAFEVLCCALLAADTLAPRLVLLLIKGLDFLHLLFAFGFIISGICFDFGWMGLVRLGYWGATFSSLFFCFLLKCASVHHNLR